MYVFLMNPSTWNSRLHIHTIIHMHPCIIYLMTVRLFVCTHRHMRGMFFGVYKSYTRLHLHNSGNRKHIIL